MLHVLLQSHSHTSLSRLLPPFPLTIETISGTLMARRRGFNRILAPGQRVDIEPFELVELHLNGSPLQQSACLIEMHEAQSVPAALALHQRIAQRVFLHPGRPWNAEYAAARLQTSSAQIRRTLFSEGAALTHICRTQRLMRGLFEAGDDKLSMTELKRRIGWPPQGDLEAAFHDRFGLSLQAARRIARTNPTSSRAPLPAAFPLSDAPACLTHRPRVGRLVKNGQSRAAGP